MTIDLKIKNALEKIKQSNFTSDGEPKYLSSNIVLINFLAGDYFEDRFLERAYMFLVPMLRNSLDKKHENLMLQDLSTAIAMSSLVIKTYSQNLCSCAGIDNAEIESFTRLMIEVTPLISPSIINSQWETASQIAQYLIDSLNAKNCIIGRGQFDAYISWFVIKLLSTVFEIPLDKRKPFHPNKEKFKHYQSILDYWDTEDPIEIEKLVCILADLHVGSDEAKKITYYLEEDEFLVFPFEIIIWLKLREYKNIKNPKKHIHPLMNTAITKTLLNINKPLPKPIKQPDVKEFLVKLQEACTISNVEIPSWL